MNTIMDAVQEVDFLIVGAGPIGSALALSLSAISKKGRDVSVVLIDQSPEQETIETARFDQKFDTKVFAVNSGSRQLLEDLGVWADINKKRVCPYDRMYVWDSEGTGSVSFSVDDLDEEPLLVKELGFIIEASIIQYALNQNISVTNNIKVCRPSKITSIEWQDGRGNVQMDSGERFITELVCAADGARSALREKVAIKTVEEDCEQRALVANIQLSKPHENCAWQIFRPIGPLAFLPLQSDDQRHCSIVWSLDTDEALRIEKLAEAEFLTELERAIESRFGSLQLNSERISFPLSQKHALDYGVPGLVLVGDAAHSIHPLAGLGANLGFQDIITLSKALFRANERGIAFGHESVISRYQRQRRVDNELTLKAMKFFKTSFADHGMGLNALRNLGLGFFSKSAPLKKIIVKQALMSKY